MMARLAKYGLVTAAMALLAACNDYALDTRWRSGDYRLIAIDAPGQMELINTRDKAWEGVGPTVFSIGADDKLLVVARHPSTNAFGEFNRSVTEYFIVQRTSGIREGPLTKDAFDRRAATGLLPKFTKTFNDLK
jgi:hypothetical protein